MQKRGTQVLVSETPAGPFQTFQDGPHTPPDWLALDGTLWVEDGTPYMVFCHEWVQIRNGTIEAMPLTGDLSKPAGPPNTLFRATDACWVRPFVHGGGKYRGYVTDGPFLHRIASGKLLMTWSSFGTAGYAVGLAISESGSIRGPWKQEPEPLFRADGGHCMLFRKLGGELTLVLHQPNVSPGERARLFPLEETEAGIRLV
jgi:hypothetical protein